MRTIAYKGNVIVQIDGKRITVQDDTHGLDEVIPALKAEEVGDGEYIYSGDLSESEMAKIFWYRCQSNYRIDLTKGEV